MLKTLDVRSLFLSVVSAGLLASVGGCGDDSADADGSGGTSGGEASSSGADASSGDEAESSGGDEGTSTGEDASCEELAVGSTPLRRLTRAQYRNSIRDVLGLAADVGSLDSDEKAGAFDSNYAAAVSPDGVEQYRAVAETLAAEVMASVELLAPCDGPEDACLENFVQSTGRRLFRRPLTDAERSDYVGLAQAADDFDNGIRVAVQAMLQSGHFLYHLEFGLPDPSGDVVALTDYEVASRLSFFLWNSVPDDALLDAADAGELASADGVRLHAERLLQDPRAREAVGEFHVQWLALDHLSTTFKDPEYYPDFTPELAEAMVAETRRFSQIVVLQGDGRLETLLTADFSYLEPQLFELYGVEPPADHNVGVPVQLDPNQRAGLLTQAAFLSEHALTNASGPIQRGVEVRTNILCDPPPPPTPGIDITPPELLPDATTREVFEEHTNNNLCASCHQLIDGIGLGFEAYDGIGAYRTMENGLPVDDLGELVATDVDGEFEGAVELAHTLAQSPQVRECVARQWFRFAFGRFEVDADQCSLDVMHQAFEESDYDVRELLLHIVETDAFRFKAAQ